MQLEHPTPAGLVQAVSGSLNTGAEKQTFIGSNAGSLAAQLGLIVAPMNLFKILQLLFLTAGGPLLAALLILMHRSRRLRPRWPAPASPALSSLPHARHEATVLWLAWLGFAAYALTWHNDWAWLEDWDLFSGLAPLTLLLVARTLFPAPGVTRVPLRLLRQACLFALALTVAQHWLYHTRVGYLNTMNKVSLGTLRDLPIQRHQLKYRVERGARYEVLDDGRLSYTPPPAYPPEFHPLRRGPDQ
jgi:hypothetical protein